MNKDFIINYNLKIWIFIPIYNFDKFLNDCFSSVYNQSYQNYSIYIIDDGSTDNSKNIIEKWIPQFEKKFIQVIVKRLSTNMGPGYTKWTAINYIRENVNKNDIFTILDGDDSYIGENALSTIRDEYIKNKCWFTYGSSTGAFTDCQNKISKEYIQTMRNEIKNIPFSHPRSCKVFLLNYFNSLDFKDKNNEWLLRISDLEFIFKCIEISGIERICFINKKIYNYREHENNCRNLVNYKYKNDVISKIMAQIPLKPIKEKINIVMCCYKRHHHLSEIINAIDNQTVASQIIFHIINTNPEKWDDTVLIKNNTSVKNITIRLCNIGTNLYGYARFLYTKYLLKTKIISYIIYFDDDQILPPKWIEQIYSTRHPLIYSCQYGAIFKKPTNDEEYNYFYRTYNNSNGNNNLSLPKFLDYGGTGGCIIDTNFFLSNIFFRCPKPFRNVEDLWLSYFVICILREHIKVFPITLATNIINDREETSLWHTIKQHKIDFLRLLVKTGFLINETEIYYDELEKILEPDDDSELSISKFIFT